MRSRGNLRATLHAAIVGQATRAGHSKPGGRSPPTPPLGYATDAITMSLSSMEKLSANYPIEPYTPPSWTSKMMPQTIPKQRIKLGTLGTPIQRWYPPGTPDGFELYVKRDDMTGSVLSGNKVRKLEFVMADAVSKKCESIISCGGIFSNSCRAAAIAARLVGMESHLLMWSKTASLPFTGNTLLDRLVGSHFYLMPLGCPFESDVYPRMRQLKEHIWKTTSKVAYEIPFGCTNEIGVWGYIEAFRELMDQGVQEKFTDIVVGVGSAGSVAGLAIGNYLTGSKLKVHGMTVCQNERYVYDETDKLLRAHGLQSADGTGVKADDIANVVNAIGVGYAENTPDELECIERVALQTGIMVDPVYSGKALYHMIKTMNDSPHLFKGRKVLFIHTGGIFDLFSGAIGSRMTTKTNAENKVYDWMTLTDSVPSTM